ncbi:MAG: hypothetical protein IKF83_00175 [Clostridia bacterium]|nr:hypothetical protein [Clostridia bacterium]
MSEYSDFDSAVEIMAYKIADCVKKSEDIKYKKELEQLKKERSLMYSGDKEIIKKILNVYGKEIKEIYENI